MHVEKMTGRIGAAITEVDLGEPIGDNLAEALREALAEHQVVVFPDQRLDIAAQKRLTQAFGPLIGDDYITPMEDDPFVIRVLKEADDKGGTFGGDWHSDLSFLAEPPAGSVLNGVEIPAYGGDTVWASQTAAWEALPEPLKALLDGRDAIHVGKPYGVKWAPPAGTRSNVSMKRGDPAADEERRHPAVFTHPRTGRRGLFVNPTYTVRLDGLTEAESRPILAQIQAHIIRPEFQVRLRWRPGTVAVWDNFQTQHYAVNDYFGQRRLMYRTTFGGPPPVH
jgi:taurine dioxygenase